MEMRETDALVARLRASGSVFAEEELAELQRAADASDDPVALEMFVERRTLGEPIEHIVGSARFGELRVVVHQGVFVPRRRTELLATIVAERLRALADHDERPPRLLDFGCGTGAIAALATHRVPGIDVVAVDADPGAVACARVNLPGALVLQASALDALDAHTTAPFDVIAANLPYVPTAELALMPHEARDFEPLLALDGGSDGLEPLHEHAWAMAARLRTGGIAVTEVAPHQVDTATAMLEQAGFSSIAVRTDDDSGATALVATR